MSKVRETAIEALCAELGIAPEEADRLLRELVADHMRRVEAHESARLAEEAAEYRDLTILVDQETERVVAVYEEDEA